MGQSTMLLSEAAETSGSTVEQMTQDALDGKLTLHALPPCPGCGAGQGCPCQPTCSKAGTQIVWIGDWFAWHQATAESRPEGRP